ncbi:MAG: T9SS type A sorting domain-containing protein [Ignavibacteria bacterium]|nr:T9SS type A sorting domain-containing protein [Ignavibacteria bacterium]
MKDKTGAGGGYWMNLPSDSIIVFDQGPWIIGKIKNKVHLALVQWYSNKPSSIFSPGPIINGKAAMYVNPSDSLKYRIYKISKGDNNSNLDYKDWPIQFGAPKTSDGKPKIYRGQTLFSVFNAMDSTTSYRDIWKTSRDTLPIMPVEIHQLAYASKGNSNDNADIFSNIIFFEWTIINKGDNAIDSTYFSLWTDIDFLLTSKSYNIPSSDTTLNLGYLWSNNTTPSQPSIGYTLLFGPSVPSNGSTSIYKGKLKQNYKNLDMTSFHVFFGGGSTAPFDPAYSRKMAWNIARGFYTNGNVKINPSTNKPTKFTFSGDPVNDTDWLWKTYTGGGAGFNIFSGPFNLAPNDTQWVMMALIPAVGNDYRESIKIMRNKTKMLKSIPYDSLAFGKMPIAVNIKNEINILPTENFLYQNYPNPFNPTTTIGYSINKSTNVSIALYDLLGRKIRELINEVKPVGTYSFILHGKDLSSGVYFIKLQTENFYQTRKIILLK